MIEIVIVIEIVATKEVRQATEEWGRAGPRAGGWGGSEPGNKKGEEVARLRKGREGKGREARSRVRDELIHFHPRVAPGRKAVIPGTRSVFLHPHASNVPILLLR